MLKEFSDSALADVRAALPAYLARVHGNGAGEEIIAGHCRLAWRPPLPRQASHVRWCL